MNTRRTLFASLATLSLFALGCAEEVGKCDDIDRGQDTVISNDVIQFGGQAILNQACAGCHGSTIKGAARQGAPAGLDFDLYPIEEANAEGATENKGGDPIVELKPEYLRGLAERQRLVFEERDLIWQQVKDGLMPPEGLGAKYRALAKKILDSDEADPCTRGNPYKDITDKQSQDVLRNWLACGAPIVESQGPSVKKNLTAGVEGYQYMMCGDEAPAEDGGAPVAITLDDVQERVIDVACATCHGGAIEPDLSDADKSFAYFSGEKCNDKPYLDVATKDPAKSYLHELVTKEKPACTPAGRMPQGSMLSSTQLKLIEDWIKAGSPRD